MIYFNKAIILFLVIFYETSCISFNSLSRKIIANENQWTDKNFIFSDVSKELSKQKKINENWSSFDSGKKIPYFKLKNSRGKILGDHVAENEKFLVINLENNKKLRNYFVDYRYKRKNISKEIEKKNFSNILTKKISKRSYIYRIYENSIIKKYFKLITN